MKVVVVAVHPEPAGCVDTSCQSVCNGTEYFSPPLTSGKLAIPVIFLILLVDPIL